MSDETRTVTDPIRRALQEHGWYVADVVTAKWVESDKWLPIVRSAALPTSTEGLDRIRVAQAVGKVWIDDILASDELRRTGMSHPVAMVMAALDGETEPRELGISEANEPKFRRLASLSPSPTEDPA